MKKKIILFILLGVAIVVFVWLHSYFWKPKKDISNDRTKVLLIGLDGATWDVMLPLIRQNKLPNIKRLMKRGYWGGLQAFSLTSEVSWTNIATGKTPKKHGIIERLMEDPDTRELIPVTSNLRKVKALWNILSEYNRTVGVVGYLVTWPPEEINGVMISDRMHQAGYFSEGYTYPSLVELCNQQEFEGFRNSEEKIFSRIEKDEFPTFNWGTGMQDNFTSKFANYLMEKLDFDFFALCLVGTDRVSHYFWKYMEPAGFKVTKEEIKKYGKVIKDYYIYCDGIIGDLLNKIDNDTIVVIVSDHGFRADYYDHINSGNHSEIGIIIISSKHARHRKIETASVYDITPTILYLMGLPVAEDMDGLVLTEVIDINFLKTQPIKYIKSYETGIGKKDKKPIPSPLDEELKERMRSLGYIN